MSKQFALANAVCAALGILPHSNYGDLQPGQVCLANDSLFSQATFQQEVTSFGIGYSDPNRNQLSALLDFLAPRRSGPRNAIVTVYDETEPFETINPEKVKREILGDFPMVKQRTSTKVTRKLVNRGLSIAIDNDQVKDKPDFLNMHTMWLIDLLRRASILEAIALHEATAATANLIMNVNTDPDLDVQSVNVQVLAPATGFKANRALFGEEATLLRKAAYRKQNNAGGYASANALSDTEIATACGLDRVLTNAERYNNGGTKDTFLGSKVLLFTAQDKESPEDNSNIVRHVSNADMGGGEFAVYVQEYLKKKIITVENYELFAAQHTSGEALLTASAN